MKSFLSFGLLLFFLSAKYFLCLCEKNESKSGIVRRMVGGSLAEKGQLLFLVSIFEKNKFRGGFSLITPKTLVGAAHIIDRDEMVDLFGRIGDVNKFRGEKILFAKRILHPDYVPGIFYNDIALLILLTRIDDISTIALPPRNLKFTKGYATFAGWGLTGQSKRDKTSFLRVSKVNIVDPQEPSNKFNFTSTGKEIMTVTPGVHGMNGDSGSPLMIREHNQSGRYIIIGVLSSCSTDDHEPDVYMSTSAYFDFIHNNTIGTPIYVNVR
ncbi:venom serine protease Bi-VSP-like [Centruroides sculpturatus]|uniref:venom serine protease Bi-VSP-like n=1 Tax=Centruroides sculpturatus TaxID=218467 RepID=UPI000C6EFB25|nr:venom serine protease Bi-VSP-like [Centruroides sculpturatus]